MSRAVGVVEKGCTVGVAVGLAVGDIAIELVGCAVFELAVGDAETRSVGCAVGGVETVAGLAVGDVETRSVGCAVGGVETVVGLAVGKIGAVSAMPIVRFVKHSVELGACVAVFSGEAVVTGGSIVKVGSEVGGSVKKRKSGTLVKGVLVGRCSGDSVLSSTLPMVGPKRLGRGGEGGGGLGNAMGEAVK
ncbi:hypothetical protein CYMTET_36909, partial [Cymbomonas tetramitiformis]